MFAMLVFETQAWLSAAVTVLAIVLLPLLYSALRKPGPCGLPFLGYYPFLQEEDFYIQLHDMAKKYGEVYFVNLSGQNYVYLDSLRAIKEAHVSKSHCFQARSSKYGMYQHCFQNGVLFLDGEQWRVHRRGLVQGMREVGLTPKRTELKDAIDDAVESTLEALLTSRGEPLDLTSLLLRNCTKVAVRLFLGDDVSDDEVSELGECYYKMLVPMGDLNILLVGTIAKYFVLPRIKGYSDLLREKKRFVYLLHKIVDRHKSNFDSDHEPRNIIEHYLKERDTQLKKGDPRAQYLTDAALVGTLTQVFGDGSAAIGSFLASYFGDLSHQKGAQDSVHEEINRVVGSERLPVWEDRADLPLTNSVMKELLRISKLLPIFPGLECERQTDILGVKVPKGTITLPNHWAVHHDSATFINPHKFEATRFLPGKPGADQLLTFGIGKRACVGENLVMIEFFLFLTSICQNFVLVPVENKKNEEINKTQENILNCWVRAIPRPSGRYSLSAE